MAAKRETFIELESASAVVATCGCGTGPLRGPERPRPLPRFKAPNHKKRHVTLNRDVIRIRI